MMKKGIPEVLVGPATNPYMGAKTKVGVDSELRLKWECSKDLCCHLFLLQWW